jgi:sugar (pentulose or hexulose) kinase
VPCPRRSSDIESNAFDIDRFRKVTLRFLTRGGELRVEGEGRASASSVYLGLDLGTSAVKAVVVDQLGTELAQGRAATPWREVPHGAEMAPEALLEAFYAAAERALALCRRAGPVAAVGIASQGEAGVLLDSAGTPVAPIVAWHDGRGAEQAARLRAELGEAAFIERAGRPATEMCSVAKIAWLREHLAGARRGERWLSLPEWIVHRLGGVQAAELSLASSTGLLDVVESEPFSEVITWARLPAEVLPPLRQAGGWWGRVRTPGPLQGAVLTVAGHDHLAGVVGAQATASGDVLDSCGTAEAFVAATRLDRREVARAVRAGLVVGRHVLPGRQYLMGVLTSGLALRRVLSVLGLSEASTGSVDEAAATVPTDGLRWEELFGPAPALRSSVETPPPAAAWRAALDGVTAAGEGMLAAIRSAGVAVERIVVAGGWGWSAAALAAKRAGFDVRVERAPAREATARGAALLAARAARDAHRVALPDGV